MEYKPRVIKGVQTGPEGIQLKYNNGITEPRGGFGIFSKAECQEILRIGEQVQEHEAITGDGMGRRSHSNRTSRVREVYPHPDTDWIFDKLETLLVELNKAQYHFELTGFFEGAQIYDYPAGGFLDWHMDVAKGYMSARKLSMSVQLSDGDDYEGGHLEFLGFQEKAPRGIGDITVFPAYMMHRVTEVTRGHRKSWVSWVHGPPYK